MCKDVIIYLGDHMAVGIICEYNPFHNGHLYHLNKVKEIFPNEVIVLILGGNFLQRGDVSVINKWDKTKLALEYGVDLIVELPFPFATQAADIFAKGSISLLNHLKVNYLVFGSESNDIEKLIKVSKIEINDNEEIKKYLSIGYNYPSAVSKVLKEDIATPNDILGVSYIKQINELNSPIIPLTIKRTNDYHDLELKSDISSATSIRKALKENRNIKKQVPTLKYINYVDLDNYFDYLKYKIISEHDLSIYQTVDEGIQNRLKNVINECSNVEELIMKTKSKRFTYNRIKRMLVHILCGFTKEEANKHKEITYIRILGFSNKGREYLNKIKKEVNIPILTTYSDALALELKVAKIYSLGLKNNDLIEQEYKNKPVHF